MDVPGFALVTGAASGIGKACATGFYDEGSAGIALFDVNEDALKEVKSTLEQRESRRSGTPCKILTYVVNVAVEAQVEKAVRDAAEQFGRIDYVVNAAGIAMKHEGGVAYAHTEDWKRIFDVNMNGSFYVLKAVVQIMLKQSPIVSSRDGRPLQRGSVINFSSIQGLVGIPLSGAYTATKHGVLGLTRTASEDYAKDGIRINAICPGYTETPLTTKTPAILKAMEEKVATSVPMQRMGQPSEIADGVLYLAGGRSSFVTGIALSVDGGYCQR